MTHLSHTPELLAPAGSPEALRAAVANGADAVYLGVDRLNARRGAANFTLETLSEATEHAHLAGTRVYLTANVVVLPSEMRQALELVDEAWARGIDAVIVQDLGFLRVLRQALPYVRIHASTQIDAHNAQTVRALAALGVSRVTLAREMSVDEIAAAVRVGAESGVEVESFVHGALCVCYSGQCLLSSMIGGRSANRGMCAQPCRLPYELRDAGGASRDVAGAHLLSPKDLAGVDLLPQLVATGAAALKIEGRMKSPEYVALVTGTYRAALDRAIADAEGFEVRDGERSVLSEAFSRGFTTAYLSEERGNEIMSYRRPNNRGVPVGRLVAVTGTTATISLDAPMDSEDTIEVWTSAGRFTQRVGPIGSEDAPRTSASSGERVSFGLEGQAAQGDRVFRVANASLLSAARRTFDAPAEVPLRFEVRMTEGVPLTVRVTDREGRSGYAEGPVIERARTKAVTVDELTEHVGRLGGTPYTAASWDLELGADVGAGFSALHRVRREAIAAYESVLLAEWSDRRATSPRLPAPSGHRATAPAGVALVATCEDLPSAQAALDAGADEAHVPVYSLRGELPAGVVPVVPRVLHDREFDRAVQLAGSASRASVGNLGALAPVSHEAETDAHWGLNVVNPWTAAALAELGASHVWASPELTADQVRDVVAASPVSVGVGVWGRQELMVTEHCILMAEGECDRACATCDRRRAGRVLRDRKGYEFPVATDVTGRSHLYNSVPLDLSRALDEVLATGVSAVRLDFSVEDSAGIARTVAAWRAELDRVIAGGRPSSIEPKGTATTGHFFRGVS